MCVCVFEQFMYGDMFICRCVYTLVYEFVNRYTCVNISMYSNVHVHVFFMYIMYIMHSVPGYIYNYDCPYLCLVSINRYTPMNSKLYTHIHIQIFILTAKHYHSPVSLIYFFIMSFFRLQLEVYHHITTRFPSVKRYNNR